MNNVLRMSNGRPYWFYGSSDASRICAWCVNCGVGITDAERDKRDADPTTDATCCLYCQHGQTRYIPDFVGTFTRNGKTVAYGYIEDEPDNDIEDCPMCEGATTMDDREHLERCYRRLYRAILVDHNSLLASREKAAIRAAVDRIREREGDAAANEANDTAMANGYHR